MPPRPRLLPLLLLLGCGHSEPFTNPDTSTDQPFDPGPPVRITANRGGDLEPAWLADGSGTLYSVADPGREDRDVCLGMIPAGSNRQSELWCDVPEGRGFTAPGRQILHCTFGSTLTHPEWGPLILDLLRQHPETYQEVLREHFVRHLKALSF